VREVWDEGVGGRGCRAGEGVLFYGRKREADEVGFCAFCRIL
jgi:hypothetical protein